MFNLAFAETNPNADRPEGAANPQQEEGQEEPGAKDEAKTVFMAMLPWGVSFLFHAGLVLLAFFAIWAIIQNKEEEKEIIPSVNMSKDPGSPMVMKQTDVVKPSASRRSVTRKPTKTQTN